MRKRRSDPSAFQEPHLHGGAHTPDPSEARAERTLRKARARRDNDDERVEHTVWDEPGIVPELAGEPSADELTYPRWLEKRSLETSERKSWLATFALALAAGPWAILNAFYGSVQSMFGIAAMVVFAPVAEEIAKTAAAMYVVEKKPFLFKHRIQIVICAVAAALTFASVENLLYLHVYIPDPPVWLIRWRWSVCVGLHMGCTFIAGLGLLRIWSDAQQRRARPRLTLAFPYLVTAMVIHGTYNAFAVVFSLVQHRL